MRPRHRPPSCEISSSCRPSPKYSWRSSPRLLKGRTARRIRGAARLGHGRRHPGRGGRGDEAVAAARQRLDEARVVGVVAERRAQAFHRGVEAVFEVHVGAVGPELPAQLLPRHHVARPPQQQPEDLERLFLQADARAFPTAARATVRPVRRPRTGWRLPTLPACPQGLLRRLSAFPAANRRPVARCHQHVTSSHGWCMEARAAARDSAFRRADQAALEGRDRCAGSVDGWRWQSRSWLWTGAPGRPNSPGRR